MYYYYYLKEASHLIRRAYEKTEEVLRKNEALLDEASKSIDDS